MVVLSESKFIVLKNGWYNVVVVAFKSSFIEFQSKTVQK